MAAAHRTWRGAARVYVRPEALYAVREDRAGSGLVLASTTDSARVAWDRTTELGEVILAMLDRSGDGIEQPSDKSELATRGRAFREPLLSLSNLESWEGFVEPAMLISVLRTAGSSLQLSPMTRARDRIGGFHPTGGFVTVKESDPRVLGEAVETLAMSHGISPDSS